MDGVVSAHDKVLFVGKWKAGKSVFTQQLAHCVGGGVDFLRYKVKGPSSVLYVAAEGDLDELQLRSRAMSKVIRPMKNMVWYWPMPEEMLNIERGYQLLVSKAEEIREVIGTYPSMTIFDPVKDLMVGSLSKDEDVGAFLRNMNRYQALTNGANVLVHHTHRPVRDQEGSEIEESNDSFYGSFRWPGWARHIYYTKAQPDDSRLLWAAPGRRSTKLPTFKDALRLTLIEPDPLIFVPYRDGWTPTMATIMAVFEANELSVAGFSNVQLTDRLEKSRSTISESLNKLERMGLVMETVVGREKIWSKVPTVDPTVLKIQTDR